MGDRGTETPSLPMSVTRCRGYAGGEPAPLTATSLGQSAMGEKMQRGFMATNMICVLFTAL